VDGPWRVSHYHSEIAKDAEIKLADIAINELGFDGR
jgi:hypothetical protein